MSVSTATTAITQTTAEVARVLKYSERHLRRLARLGRIPARRVGPRGQLRFVLAEVQQALQPSKPATT